MPDFPDATIKAVADAIESEIAVTGSSKAVALAALETAAPILNRAVARAVLALDQEDSNLTRRGAPNVGPYGDMASSLRRLARGEKLPDLTELRGGFGATPGK